MGAEFASPKLFYVFLICCLTLILFTISGFAAKLDPNEVKALRDIAGRLGKKDWDFGKDPCSGDGNWVVKDGRKGFESNVTCDCSFNHNATCHVISIALKSQNLSGPVPPEFSTLRYLQKLDISRNVLTGSIPRQWATMHLVELSVMGNQLSGPFPKVLTNITTLANLSIEGNLFSGHIPPEIRNLINMKRIHLSSNAFTGELPVALAKLTNLIDIRISANNFTGKIPEFIKRWTHIEKLHMQGCSLEGPIPSSISSLTKLVDLYVLQHYILYVPSIDKMNILSDCLCSIMIIIRRISDLKGRGSTFPRLKNMESMKTLVLRKCLIYGEIPGYIGDMIKLKTLDLSFNNLTGEIPTSFEQLGKVDFMYLTGNNLAGHVPGWVLGRNKNVDISYNNFSWESSSPVECPRGSVNLVESYSSSANKIREVHPCLKRNFPCSASSKQHHYSLHINCGGKEKIISGTTNTTYEADLEARGASMFYLSQNWAFSSTGNFMDNDVDGDVYIETNTSALSNVSSLNAELLGKRIFDVYIQGKLVLKDFNIENEAGGPGKPLVKNFTVAVTRHTLKIHFYWAGRGTTGIPIRSKYGPLISAISVDPNFKPPSLDSKKNYIIVVAGSVAAAVFLVLLVLAIMRRKGWLGGKIYADKVTVCFTELPHYSDSIHNDNLAYVLQERGSLLELVDPNLGSEYSSEEAMVMLNVALLCTNASPTLRPIMSQVVSMLEGRTDVQDLLSDPGFSAIDSKFKAIRNHFWQNPSQTQSFATNGPCTDSSVTITEREESGHLLRVSSVKSHE
ncbi:hypothetical protein L1049_023750 [Liquidambar formosana]|uniref:non-specific serine/threonine protein kinase n=1 Tax=Liquidambar formosana TaxID=63359 RepID=A0AAP0X487_LIQFO